jgi:hypothetical protein
MSTQNANNVTITGGTLNGVTGTNAGLTVGTATNATNATNATTATNANQFQGKTKLGLGITGEVWNNVTGSRSFNIQYTNSNSYPIGVSARTQCSGASAINFIVDGVSISNFNWQWNGCGSFGGGFVIVPPGSTYQLNSGQGLDYWRELY